MIGPIILSILAAFAYTASKYGDAWGLPDWSLSFATLLTVIFGGYALVPMVERGLDFMADWYKRMQKAAAITQISLLMETAKGMRPDQIDMVLRSPLYIRKRLHPTNLGVIPEFLFGDEWISQEFVKEFMDKSTEEYLYPVNNYSDSKARDHANALVDFFCGFGLAERGSGPNRAKWIEPYADVRKYLGV